MSVLEEYLSGLIEHSPLWKTDTIVISACSGGADSMALTSVLSKIADVENVDVHVVHIHHHLRGAEADRDAKLVEEFCLAKELPFTKVDVDVQALVASTGMSIEEAARSLRYEALETCRKELNASAIFLGQHRDDQAETVILNLLRGAGTRGMRGMQAVNGYLARPFLAVAKEELKRYCQEENIAYGEDSTNQDTDFTRNWVRKEVIPLLEQKNPLIKKQLAQAATLAGWDEEYMQKEAHKYLQAYGTQMGEFYDVEAGEVFLHLPPAIQTRVLRIMLGVAGAKEVSFEHIKDLIKLISKGEDNKALDVPGKVRAIYSNCRLLVGKNKRSRTEEREAKNKQKEYQRNACKSGENIN